MALFLVIGHPMSAIGVVRFQQRDDVDGQSQVSAHERATPVALMLFRTAGVSPAQKS
ncbi:hypothetical protein [Reyranella sp.]|uniref:hypothetical protein n=1 Tax=Reyranella sp. TaxID=1929291 RepID=UPI003D0F4BAE